MATASSGPRLAARPVEVKNTELTTTGRPRLPVLDGVRGIAIVVVLIYHFVTFPSGGFLGVDLFFVLSGYLITTRLLYDANEFGLTHLRNFYYGRVLRIMPAVFEMLLLYSAMKLARPAQIHLFRENVLSALFLYSNWTRAFLMGYPDYLGHTWSLAIEEQFYLFWPATLFVILKFRSRRTLLPWVTLGMVVGLWVLRYAMAVNHAPPDRLYNGTDTRIASILIGCFVAAIFQRPGFGQFVERNKTAATSCFVLAIAAMGWIVAAAGLQTMWVYEWGLCVFSTGSAVVVAYVRTFQTGIAGKLLAWKPLVYLGKRSYGIYLLHFPIFMWLLFIDKLHPGAQVALLGTVLTLPLAAFSWRFVEEPCMRFGKRR